MSTRIQPGVDGVRGFAHRNVYALWRVHGICSYIGGMEGEEEKGGRAKGSDRAGPVTFMEISPHSLRKPDLWTTFRRSMNLVSEVLF